MTLSVISWLYILSLHCVIRPIWHVSSRSGEAVVANCYSPLRLKNFYCSSLNVAYRGFMTDVTCRLTAKNRDLLRNPTLSSGVWATFTCSLNRRQRRMGCRGRDPPRQYLTCLGRPVLTTHQYFDRCFFSFSRTSEYRTSLSLSSAMRPVYSF